MLSKFFKVSLTLAFVASPLLAQEGVGGFYTPAAMDARNSSNTNASTTTHTGKKAMGVNNNNSSNNDACVKYEKLTGAANISGAKFNVVVYLVAGQTFVYAPKIVEIGNQILTNFSCSYKPSNVTCSYEHYEKRISEHTVISPDPMTSNYFVINNESALYNKVDGKVVIPVTTVN